MCFVCPSFNDMYVRRLRNRIRETEKQHITTFAAKTLSLQTLFHKGVFM